MLTFTEDSHEIGTNPSKDEQKSHADVIGKFAYPLKFPVNSRAHINGVELIYGS